MLKAFALLCSIVMPSLLVAGVVRASIEEKVFQRMGQVNNIDLCTERLRSEIIPRFLAIPKLRIISFFCKQDRWFRSSLNAHVFFEAPEEVVFSDTMSVYGDMGMERSEIYLSKQACEVDHARQLEIFSRSTGLQPFYSYCYQSNSEIDRYWGLQIEGIGSSATLKHTASFPLYSRIDMRSGNVVSMVSDRLMNLGVTAISDARLASGPGRQILRVDYYHSQRIYFGQHNLATYQSAEDCLVNLKRVSSDIFLRPEIVGMYCEASQGLDGLNLVLVSASFDVILSDYTFQFMDHHGLFLNQADCEVSLDGFRRDILSSPDTDLVAMLCHSKLGRYSMRAVLKRPYNNF